MKKNIYRLTTAAILSSSVFAGTYAWYKYTEKDLTTYNGDKPVAFVGTVSDEIQRRQASRLLWQVVKQGEALFDGEAIRTGAKGEVQILFTENNRQLELEPESLIVIKRSAGEISLDLVEGSLFIAQADTSELTEGSTPSSSAPAIVLNSEKGKIDLSKASASLSKESGKELSIQVLEGSAHIEGENGAKNELNIVGNIKVLAPLAGKDLYLNAENPEKIVFEWEENSDLTNYQLFVGTGRKNLKAVTIETASKNKLQATIPYGPQYWKLTAQSLSTKKTIETPVFRNRIFARYSPTVVFPVADQKLIKDVLPTNIDFAFANYEQAQKVVLEVWSDAELKNKMTTATLGPSGTIPLENLNEGTYYYRASSFYEGHEEPSSSKIQKFSLSKKAPTMVNIEFPNFAKESTQYFVEKPKLQLSWTSENNNEVAEWKVKIYPEGADPAAISAQSLNTPLLETELPNKGRYIASIEAINHSGELIGTKMSSPLSVEPLPLLGAPTFNHEGAIQATSSGTTKVSWTSIAGANEYNLVIYKNNVEYTKIKTAKNETGLKNLMPGQYEVEVYALDKYGRNGTLSEKRTIVVPDSSEIKAPTLKKIKVN